MALSLLDQIDSPRDLKALDNRQLNALAQEVRQRMIAVTAERGGHLASSLGATDLIIALHSVFNAPEDKIIFDVGHQAYAHKLLTGRRDWFETLRSFGGVSGFTRIAESEYDSHDSGHASDGLSIALGLALSRDLRQGSEHIVTVVGDASISGGMAFEALNHIGHAARNMIIVLNDNEMSISHNVGALSLYLAKIRASRSYRRTRDAVEGRLSQLGRPGRFLVDAGERAKGSAKKFLLDGTFFEDMGITYMGPVDGHSIAHLREVLQAAKQISGPVLIHALTRKGKGYQPAEQDPEGFHGATHFDVLTGYFKPKDPQLSYTECFAQALIAEAEHNPDIMAITAAMPNGTGLDLFEQRFPDRFFDVGIAEEHAVALSAGFGLGGRVPVVAIYSTFLQRAFDQVVTNVALMNQHVVFCLDRGGLVGEDGTTHHGAFDLAYLRVIPNMQIMAPATGVQLVDALHTALQMSGPVAIRYPRGKIPEGSAELEAHAPALLPIAKASCMKEGSDIALLALGSMVLPALAAAEVLAYRGISVAVYNMLWLKPLDKELLAQLLRIPLLVTLEEGTLSGGFGSAVLEALAESALSQSGALASEIALSGQSRGTQPQVLRIGLPDAFITHGDSESLLASVGLNVDALVERIADVWQGQNQA